MDISLEALLGQENLTELILLQVSLRIAQALQDTHAQGIIHRDIKPGNILLKMRDQKEIAEVKLADFGSATKNITNEMCGTVDFMAPEIFRGEPITPQADIYSFGITLLVMSHSFSILEKNENLSEASKRLYSFQSKYRDEKSIHENEEYKAITKIIIQNKEYSSLMAAAESKVERSPGYLDLIRQCMSSEPAARCSIDKVIATLKEMISQKGFAAIPEESYSSSSSSTIETSSVRYDSVEMLPEDDDNDDLPPYLLEQMTGSIPEMPKAPKGYTNMPLSPLRAHSIMLSATSLPQEADLFTLAVPAKK